jgi:hypothetical protein
MNRSLTFTSAVIVAALSLAAAPAAAQAHRGSSGHQGGGGGHAASGQSAPRQAPARQAAPRAAQGRSSSAPSSGAQGRSYQAPQGRTYAAPRALPRSSGSGSNGAGTAVPRYSSPSVRGGGSGYAASGNRGYAGYMSTAHPYLSRPYVRPYGWTPYFPFRFVRPYYVFSPWLSLGFGMWVGYPVPYPWVYLGDYQPTVFGDPDGGDFLNNGYQVAPGSSANGAANSSGGVSFDVQPPDANLFVDGQYVGVVGSFGPSSEPLTLEPGQHRIAIQHEGYRPLEWDVTIEPGQVIPYRGVLERQ